MDRIHIYNKSSEIMSEVVDTSIDLVVTDPPWNMGVQFGHTEDRQSLDDYKELVMSVIRQIKRVLTNQGICAVVLAEEVQFENQNTNLPKLYTDMFSVNGLYKVGSVEIGFIEEGKGWNIKRLFGWNTYAKDKLYSKQGAILVFSKNPHTNVDVSKIRNKVFKFKETTEHPCATSEHMAKSLLDTFYKKGDRVLDPFMGTANIGIEVVSRGGYFYGYELVTDYFNVAKKKLFNFSF